MKKIFLFIMLFLMPIMVNAKELYIENLNVLNGELTIPFDKYNNEYTVILDNIEYNLELDYDVLEGVLVSVIDNFDLVNNSVVTLTLSYENNSVDYHFHIYKDEVIENVVFNEKKDDYNDNFMYKYKLYVIPSVGLLLIIIIHRMLFRKHKR